MAKIDNVSDTTSAGLTLPREVHVPQPPAPEPELIGKVPFAKPPTTGRNALAQGLARFDDLKAERDQLERELLAARERIHLLEVQIAEIEGTRATIESRISTCVLERDQAVREAGAAIGVIEAIALVCNKYVEKADANR